jgi:hypothetical protein
MRDANKLKKILDLYYLSIGMLVNMLVISYMLQWAR